MKLIDKLQKGAAKLTEMRQTMVALDGLAVDLTSEAERLAKALESIDARVLLAVQPDKNHLPADDAARLQRFNALREKIGLVPGAKANTARKIEALELELEEGFREVHSEYRARAKDRLDNALADDIKRNLPLCGGDARRAALAAKSAAEHGDGKLWVEWFSSPYLNGCILSRIERLIVQTTRFDAGQPVRPAASAPSGAVD